MIDGKDDFKNNFQILGMKFEKINFGTKMRIDPKYKDEKCIFAFFFPVLFGKVVCKTNVLVGGTHYLIKVLR